MRKNYLRGKEVKKDKIPEIAFSNSDKSKHMTTLEVTHSVHKGGREDSSSLPFKHDMSASRSMVI